MWGLNLYLLTVQTRNIEPIQLQFCLFNITRYQNIVSYLIRFCDAGPQSIQQWLTCFVFAEKDHRRLRLSFPAKMNVIVVFVSLETELNCHF